MRKCTGTDTGCLVPVKNWTRKQIWEYAKVLDSQSLPAHHFSFSALCFFLHSGQNSSQKAIDSRGGWKEPKLWPTRWQKPLNLKNASCFFIRCRMNMYFAFPFARLFKEYHSLNYMTAQIEIAGALFYNSIGELSVKLSILWRLLTSVLTWIFFLLLLLSNRTDINLLW